MRNLCFVPFFDFDLQGEIVNISFFDDYNTKQTFYKCEAKTEAFVLALILSKLGVMSLDDGFLSGECNVGEEEIDEIDFFSISNVVLGEHLKDYDDFDEIVILAKLLCKTINASLYVGREKVCDDSDVDLEQAIKIANNLKSKTCDGLYVYFCLDDDSLVCSEQFLIMSKLKDGDFLDFMKITCLKNINGMIALASKKACKSFTLKPFFEVYNANNH